jgi:hypothetical protein
MADIGILEVSLQSFGDWPIIYQFDGIHILNGGGSSDGGDGGGETEEPDFYAWVRGTVTKQSMPFESQVTAFTVSPTPELLGTTTTDPDTGAYEIDVAPYTGEVMVFAAMDYGRVFEAGYNLAADQVIHPETPNRCVYKAKNAGALGDTEPDWPLVGEITSGAVVLEAHSLYEPLAGGYLKPTIEAK